MEARARWLSFLAVLSMLLVPVAAQGGRFALTAAFEPATAKPGDTVHLVLSATVAPGWHAYGRLEKTNLPVALKPDRLQLGGLELVGGAEVPPGEPKMQFGMQSFPLPNAFVVRQAMRVPAAAGGGAIAVAGALDYQLCDENKCLPPSKEPFAATLQVVAAAAPDAGLGTVPGLRLEPDEKLTVTARLEPKTARAGETVTLVLDVTVDDRYHAYGTLEKTNVPVSLDHARLRLGGLEAVGAANVPPGTSTPFFGMETFPLPHRFEVTQRLRVPDGTAPGPIAIEGLLHYQLCDENSCDPEDDIRFSATLQVEAGAARAEVVVPPPVAPSSNGAVGADNPFGGSWWALILACIGGGLFALAMPCTYPMIPITFSFFTKQAEKRHGKVLPLALAYGFGIIVMFVGVGVLLSAVIIDVVNHWVTNVVIGAMFFFFAFVLFGWINLNPPQWMNRLATKAQATAQGQSSGATGMLTAGLGVFFMGATLVITSFTCTAPIVGSLIANVAQYGTPRVAIGMAIFGLTMAIPFVALSLMPTKVKAMPKSGEWMETLKVSLGFVELAAAFKFVSMVDFYFGWQILPRELFLLLWTAIFVLWAGYLFGILRKAGTPSQGVSNGRMAGGMVVTLLATYFLFGALGFKVDFYLTNFIPGYSAQSVIARGGSAGGEEGGGEHVLGEHRIVLEDQQKAVRVAKADDKLLLYNFTGFT